MAKKKTAPKVRKARANRKYLDHERTAAITLAKTDGPSAAGRKLGIPEPTVRAWVEGWRTPQALRLYEENKGDLAEAFRDTAWECLGIARDKAEDAAFNHLMIGAGICTDKSQLLDGKPTARNRNDNTNLDALLDVSKLTPEQLAAFVALLATLRGSTPVPTADPGGTGGTGAEGQGPVVPRALPAVLG